MRLPTAMLLCFLMLLVGSPLCLFAYPTIEAEDYADMSGIQLENNGTTVGFIDAGDWLRYDAVDFGDGPAAIEMMVAKASTGGALALHLDELNGPMIGTFSPEATGGWQAFQLQLSNLTDVQGVHDLYLVAEGANGVCNIDYFTFTDQGVYVPDWQLFWADEFNGTDVDTTYWRKVYHGNPDNGELQFYTPRPENIVVSDGTLKLIAHRETFTGQGPWMSAPVTRQYTSGKVETADHITFQYGRIEARMKLPRGKGTWPAFWMLGENIFDSNVGWPRCGEIDIMEHGQDFDNLGAAIHTQAYNHTIGTQITGTYQISTYDTQFHTYGVEWGADKMRFYVDDDYYLTITKDALGSTVEEWPFDQPFFLILNHAVGGAWGGTPDDSLYPHTVEVDWVRVYKDQGTTTIRDFAASSANWQLKLIPNPASSQVQVHLMSQPSPHEGVEVHLTDLQGRLIQQTNFHEQATLDVGSLPQGIYYVLLTYQGHVLASEKLLK